MGIDCLSILYAFVNVILLLSPTPLKLSSLYLSHTPNSAIRNHSLLGVLASCLAPLHIYACVGRSREACVVSSHYVATLAFHSRHLSSLSSSLPSSSAPPDGISPTSSSPSPQVSYPSYDLASTSCILLHSLPLSTVDQCTVHTSASGPRIDATNCRSVTQGRTP